jgi:hypothetical protein
VPDLPTTQLDLFADSRDIMLRNDLIVALLGRDPLRSRRALTALGDEFPGQAVLADAAPLVAALEAKDTAPLDDAATACAARAELELRLAPAAERVLGAPDAAAWLRPWWTGLARRAAALPFQPDAAAGHAAALWLLACEWANAARAVATIGSWRRIPQPLAWMAQARWHLEGRDATWPLLVELAWLAPGRLLALAQDLPDPALRRLMTRFDDELDAAADRETWAWLPAWALAEQPMLSSAMEQAQPWRQTEPEQGWQSMMALLRLERQGRHRDVVEHRRRLRELHPGVFAAYMRSR